MIAAIAAVIWRITDDVLFMLWFGMKLKSKEVDSRWKRCLNQAAGILVLGLCSYLTSVRANVFTSFLWRFIGMMAYAVICKEEAWNKKVYASSVFTLAYYAHTIVFVTPVLAGVRRGEILLFSGSLVFNKICVQILIWMAALLFVGIVRNGINFSKINNRWEFREGMCAGLAVLEIYMKYTLNEFSKKENLIVEMTVFALIILSLIMIVLVFVEQYFVNEDREAKRRQMELLQSYQYETMKQRIEADQDVRLLYHDLKNHLLSLNALSADDEKVKEYVANMRKRLEGYETVVETGNDMLNGILTEKMKAAKRYGIRMNVFVNFSKITFLRDMDICTIFGNAVDNAIDASLKVEDKEKRMIQIKSGVFANHLVIRISNYSEEPLTMRDGLPVTTKEDGGQHGLGLLSVKKTAAEYRGVITVEKDQDQFILKIMIPM